MDNDTVQNWRDFQRPLLTMLFSMSYVFCVVCLLIAVMVWCFLHPDDVDIMTIVAIALGIIGLIGTPLGGIMGYHFAKSTMKDSTAQTNKES